MKPIETKQTQMKRNQKIRTKQNQRNEIKHARQTRGNGNRPIEKKMSSKDV